MRHLLSFRVMSASQLPPPCGEGDAGEARAGWGSCNLGRHCEERSDAAIHGGCQVDCFASLAMTRRLSVLRDADRLSGEPRFDVLDRVHEILAVIVFRRVAE